MKFLIISFLVLCIYASGISCQGGQQSVEAIRDELLRRANYLTVLVSGEVKLLTVENRVLAAEGLEFELRGLIELSLELRATQQMNVTNTEIRRLENVLNAIEIRIQQQLAAVGRQFVSRQEIDRLLQGTRNLITLVAETVQKLRLANRSVSALGLQEEEARLVQIEIELRATQNPQEVRRLEELLIEADYRVYEIINQLEASGVRRKRDLKADVLARAVELIAIANNTVQALRQQRRFGAAELIQSRLSDIQLLYADLMNVTAEADIARLESRLINQEFQLTADLNSVGRPVDFQQYKKQLQTGAEALQAWVTVEVAALKAANNSAEITVIERELAAVNSILAEVNNATTRQALQPLELRLSEVEFRLYEELLKLDRPNAYRRLLLTLAEDLAVRVVVAIQQLSRTGRSLEAEGLRLLEQDLVLLDVEVRDAISNEELTALEERLRRLESRVYEQLEALNLRQPGGPPRRKRDLKTDVLARAQEMIKLAKEAIAAFTAQNRTNAVSLIQTHERDLETIVAELNAATNESQIGPLEGRAIRVEFQLVDDLRRLGRPIDLFERRDLLITRAEGLEAWAKVEIANAVNRSVEVQRAQELLSGIANLVALLKNATLQSDLDMYEDRLNSVEENLIMELRTLGSPSIPRDQIIALERRAEELAIRLLIEIRRLYAEGRTLLAEGLQAEERNLVDLDVDLRTAITPERIVRVEQRLTEAETRVAAELQRIRG